MLFSNPVKKYLSIIDKIKSFYKNSLLGLYKFQKVCYTEIARATAFAKPEKGRIRYEDYRCWKTNECV